MPRPLEALFATQRWLIAALVATMVVLVTVEVVLRTVFSVSLRFTHEVAGYLLVGASFIGFAVALVEGDLFRVGFVQERLPGALRRTLQVLFDLLALSFCLVVDWHLVTFVASSLRRGVVEASSLATPLWIPQSLMPLGMSLLIVALLVRLHGDVRALVREAG